MTEKTSPNSLTSKLTMTLQGKEGAIGIRKNVVKAMGCPRYISLRVSRKSNSLLLLPCEPIDVMSFEMPQDFLSGRHVNFRIHSLQFVRDLLKSNELNHNTTYVLEGTYLQGNNAVVFPINTALPMNDEMKIEREVV